jgi:cyclopropane fatty-acyl-phospholipid synthase-like methyltransferase
VVQELADLAPGHALDLGTGEGRTAVWLAGRGWQVTAVGFSAAGLDKGRRLASARGVTVGWVLADVRDYQPCPYFFQLVLVVCPQLREAEQEAVLRRAVTALTPGGALLWPAITC